MTNTIIVPSSVEDRKKIKACMQEISNSYTRIDAEKDFIKNAIEDLQDAVGVSKKDLKKLAKIYHKQNLAEMVSELEDLEALFEVTK